MDPGALQLTIGKWQLSGRRKEGRLHEQEEGLNIFFLPLRLRFSIPIMQRFVYYLFLWII